MASILEGELAQRVTTALVAGGIPMPLTLKRTTITGGTSYDPGEETTTDHPCNGWVEAYTDDEIDGLRIARSDVRVMILTNTTEITPDDQTDAIMVQGKAHTIINVKHDASGALYEIQARA